MQVIFDVIKDSEVYSIRPTHRVHWLVLIEYKLSSKRKKKGKKKQKKETVSFEELMFCDAFIDIEISLVKAF